LTIPLTKDGSSNCQQLTMDASTFGPPPLKFIEEKVLPPNWFIFGQPVLQQLYTVFDFTAFEGRGGLHFARAVKPNLPPASSAIVVPIMPSAQSGMPVR
jgi:hypothetical protein